MKTTQSSRIFFLTQITLILRLSWTPLTMDLKNLGLFLWWYCDRLDIYCCFSPGPFWSRDDDDYNFLKISLTCYPLCNFLITQLFNLKYLLDGYKIKTSLLRVNTQHHLRTMTINLISLKLNRMALQTDYSLYSFIEYLSNFPRRNCILKIPPAYSTALHTRSHDHRPQNRRLSTSPVPTKTFNFHQRISLHTRRVCAITLDDLLWESNGMKESDGCINLLNEHRYANNTSQSTQLLGGTTQNTTSQQVE